MRRDRRCDTAYFVTRQVWVSCFHSVGYCLVPQAVPNSDHALRSLGLPRVARIRVPAGDAPQTGKCSSDPITTLAVQQRKATDKYELLDDPVATRW